MVLFPWKNRVGDVVYHFCFKQYKFEIKEITSLSRLNCLLGFPQHAITKSASDEDF